MESAHLLVIREGREKEKEHSKRKRMKVSETKREENTSKGKGHGMGACYRQAQCLWLSEGPGQGVQTDAKLRQAPVEDESSRTDLFSCNGRAGEVMRCSTFRKIIKFEL